MLNLYPDFIPALIGKGESIMRITVSDIYSLGSEQIFNDLSIEELKKITGGYRSRRGNYRSTETPLPLSIEAQFQDWRTELNTIMDNLRQRLDT